MIEAVTPALFRSFAICKPSSPSEISIFAFGSFAAIALLGKSAISEILLRTKCRLKASTNANAIPAAAGQYLAIAFFNLDS